MKFLVIWNIIKFSIIIYSFTTGVSVSPNLRLVWFIHWLIQKLGLLSPNLNLCPKRKFSLLPLKVFLFFNHVTKRLEFIINEIVCSISFIIWIYFRVILVLSLSFGMHCNKSHIITESNINNPSLFLLKKKYLLLIFYLS